MSELREGCTGKRGFEKVASESAARSSPGPALGFATLLLLDSLAFHFAPFTDRLSERTRDGTLLLSVPSATVRAAGLTWLSSKCEKVDRHVGPQSSARRVSQS